MTAIYPLSRDDWLDAQAQRVDGMPLPDAEEARFRHRPVRPGLRFQLVEREAATEAGLVVEGFVDFVMILDERR